MARIARARTRKCKVTAHDMVFVTKRQEGDMETLTIKDDLHFWSLWDMLSGN